jgi:hypothetical protein
VTQFTVDPNHPQFRDAFEREIMRRKDLHEVVLLGKKDSEMNEEELRQALRFAMARLLKELRPA